MSYQYCPDSQYVDRVQVLRSGFRLRFQFPDAIRQAAQHRFGAAATNQYGRSKKKSNFRRQPQQPQKLMLMTDKSGLRHPFTMWFRSATARTLKAHMQVAPPLRSHRMTDSTLSVLPRIEIHWKIPSVAGANSPVYAHRKS